MNPITNIKVTINPDGEKVIQWYLTPNYKYTTPINFYIEWARSGGDWVPLMGPLSNLCTYTDPNKYNWNKDRDLYYRVKFTDASGEHISAPARAGDGFLNRHDYLLYRDMLRKECLLLSKFTGMSGELMRRKHWGTPCPVCLDHDTGEVTNGRCPQCLGTRFVGGYYSAIKWPVSEVTLPKTKKTNDTGGKGTMDDKSRIVRSLAIPMPDSFDIWTHYGNNDRYVIDSVDPVASFKGIIVAVNLSLKKLPYTDIVYEAPVDTSSQEDLVTPGLDNGWRPNLDDDY